MDYGSLTNLAARAVHHLGLAAWYGGAWMGAVGMNAATREVEDHTQRTRVANAAWFRWAPVTAFSILSHLVAALALGRFSPRSSGDVAWRGLVAVRIGATVAALLATVETGRSGLEVVRAGDVPVASAVHPISDTPESVARAQRRLRVAQWLVPAFTGVIWLVEAYQEVLADR